MAVARRAQVVLGLVVLVVLALASSPSQGAPSAKPPDFDKAAAAVEKHADKWLDKPGVVGVGVGVNKAGKAVVHVYKLKDADEDIPSDVDGVAVEQIQSGRFDPRALPTDRWPRPVPIGVSSGLADFATGTLGARVTDGTNVYALSNNHVFAGVNTASVGDAITQPGVEDGGSDPADRIATLADYQAIDFIGGDNIMDAAIAVTSAGNVGTATPPDGYGAPSTIPAAASIGMGVQKYGRTTGFQLGAVADINFSVDVCYFALGEFCFPGYEARFVNQIAVSGASFSAPGDSGSLMVTQGGNQPVALLFAGDGTLTIGNPIVPVLQRFGVTIEGQPPGDGPPGAPTSPSALAGAGSVTLSWNAPAFDGGSPISNYKVYRGTSPGAVSFHANAGTTTTYSDTGVTNGTTYYYKVSAENANGEGPLSNEANATPTDLVVPSEPLPVLDSFNRANESPLSDAGKWSNAVNGGVENGLHVNANQLACSVSTTCTAWRSNAQYGPDAEASARIATLPGTSNGLRLYLRVQSPGTSGYDGYVLLTTEQTGTDQVAIYRITNSGFTALLTIPQELAAGDTMLLRARASTLEAWRHDGTSWSRLGVVQDATYAATGFTGVGMRGTTGRLDDFGARSLSQSPPLAPTSLTALAGEASVSLSWNAPAFDGGSPISNYKVYRGTSPGSVSFHANAGATTSYPDTGLTNGTTYYYKVSAVNANGEGALSNEANATPADLIAPAEPLVALDTFNRPNESPLSGAGTWSNNLNGGVENGLHVNGNQLACSVSTTCTAWRNNAQYGPEAEAWTRIVTLPGNGNAIRLYVRVQSPGTSAYDGYVLLTSQQAGTDQVTIYRITNSGFTALVSVPQELAAGDTLLLRATGSTLEAWRHDGVVWSRFGVVQDATYAAAGFSGVGLRGTSGRLDDFGARTMGAPPPDTEPPGPPGTLTANVFSDTQIELSWGVATDNVGPISYLIERCSGSGCSNFAEIAAGTSTTHMDVGLTPSTEYSYRVRAVDAADNEGPYSNTASATTPAPPDTEPPSAPANLNATATSPTQIDLSWDAATDNVAVALYRVERCQDAGCSDFTEIATTASTSLSNTGLTPSTSYTYRVRAQDAVPNTGGYSNTDSATTPSDVVPPVVPLPTLDTFNRRNENPLSDGGRWSNGVIGSVETGLRVNSNTLNCTKTTTCTAWRNNATYGPDTEVYARIATLPGTNNGFRLYARLQQPGASAHSGYLLRTNQLTGTDQVFLERIDSGAVVTRLTISQDLAVGDTLLLRVKGLKLEAWLRRSSAWSLLGSVVDSTYGAAGRVGVGIRGKTGRLDDFGAR